MKKGKLKVLVLVDLLAPASGPELKAELETKDWRTEREVIHALEHLGHEYALFGLYDDIAPLVARIREYEPDIVFNLTEQFWGDRSKDKCIAGVLDMLSVPYTGAGPMGLGLARDKALAKKVLGYHRIRVPKFMAFKLDKPIRPSTKSPYPMIVKPLGEDASTGIALASLVHNDAELIARVEFVHRSCGRAAIAEEYIPGREIYSSVLGNSRLQVLPPRELRWEGENAPHFLTYRLKWDEPYQRKSGLKFGFAEELTSEVERRIANIAKKTYRALESRDYARIDLRMRDDGRIYVIEVNPNPFLASDEDFALSAKKRGIEYHKLIDKIMHLALKRHEE